MLKTAYQHAYESMRPMLLHGWKMHFAVAGHGEEAEELAVKQLEEEFVPPPA